MNFVKRRIGRPVSIPTVLEKSTKLKLKISLKKFLPLRRHSI